MAVETFSNCEYRMGLPVVYSQSCLLLFVHVTDAPEGLPDISPVKTPLKGARSGYEHYKHIQAHDGYWHRGYSGQTFLIPNHRVPRHISCLFIHRSRELESSNLYFSGSWQERVAIRYFSCAAYRQERHGNREDVLTP
ncbi:hypothetical protein BDM02DRAFT_3118457 [Thelephora ganbajun]|uniref:Uncharacterized protein n=1 Tax=Thelephora ganbajun TaxID=370292 RepID=A0ACB6ZAA5_THEGA|nr:hypothetical protein BDM02DRAFT_3118457 [Thelephora ganbajun]